MNILFSSADLPFDNTISGVVNKGIDEAGKLSGRLVSVLQELGKHMQGSPRVALAVFSGWNIAAFALAYFTANSLNQRLLNRPEELDRYQLIFKTILIDGLCVGGIIYSANALLSNLTKYPVSKVIIWAAAIASIFLRALIHFRYHQQKSNSKVLDNKDDPRQLNTDLKTSDEKTKEVPKTDLKAMGEKVDEKIHDVPSTDLKAPEEKAHERTHDVPSTDLKTIEEKTTKTTSDQKTSKDQEVKNLKIDLTTPKITQPESQVDNQEQHILLVSPKKKLVAEIMKKRKGNRQLQKNQKEVGSTEVNQPRTATLEKSEHTSKIIGSPHVEMKEDKNSLNIKIEDHLRREKELTVEIEKVKKAMNKTKIEDEKKKEESPLKNELKDVHEDEMKDKTEIENTKKEMPKKEKSKELNQKTTNTPKKIFTPLKKKVKKKSEKKENKEALTPPTSKQTPPPLSNNEKKQQMNALHKGGSITDLKDMNNLKSPGKKKLISFLDDLEKTDHVEKESK